MQTHPFKPLIQKGTIKLLVGTLPPEGVKSYFCNSPNTRLWDILYAITQKKEEIGKGGNHLSDQKKSEILKILNLGITDIIYRYKRDEVSTKDKHIDPKEYSDLLSIVKQEGIQELLFVYKNAYKWFLHSLSGETPVRIRKLKNKCAPGPQEDVLLGNEQIKCTLLFPPLNRGAKGQTLIFKLKFYKKYIL